MSASSKTQKKYFLTTLFLEQFWEFLNFEKKKKKKTRKFAKSAEISAEKFFRDDFDGR